MALDVDTSHPEVCKIRFILPHDHPPGQVSVVGSFNDWTPGLDELTPNVAGERSVTVGVPYEVALIFRYLGPGNRWFDEPDADEVTTQGSILHPIVNPHVL